MDSGAQEPGCEVRAETALPQGGIDLFHVLQGGVVLNEGSTHGNVQGLMLSLPLWGRGAADRIFQSTFVEYVEELLSARRRRSFQGADERAGVVLKKAAHEIVLISDPVETLLAVGQQKASSLDAPYTEDEGFRADGGRASGERSQLDVRNLL